LKFSRAIDESQNGSRRAQNQTFYDTINFDEFVKWRTVLFDSYAIPVMANEDFFLCNRRIKAIENGFET